MALHQEMKDSEMKNDLQDIKDEFELTSEEKITEDYDYVPFVHTQGNHIRLSS